MLEDLALEEEYLSALDPGKQGLKPEQTAKTTAIIKALSALDPGKQGLKQAGG